LETCVSSSNAVSHQSKFQNGFCALVQAALARELGQVEEVGGGFRAFRELRGVIGEHGCPDVGRNAAIGHCAREEVVSSRGAISASRQGRCVDRLQNAFVAQANCVSIFNRSHVNGDVASFDHSFDRGRRVVAVGHGCRDTGLRGERLHMCLGLCSAVSTAPRHNGHVGICRVSHDRKRGRKSKKFLH
jgi:hypothetical protein